MEDRAAHAAGIAQRHPFYDRRVAEFGLALPAAQRSDGRDIKLVIRGALARLSASDGRSADDAGLTRPNSRPPTSTPSKRIGARDVFHRLRSEEAGWVDGRAVRENYEHMIQLYSKGSDAYIAFTGPLWGVAALEFWLDAGTTEIPRLLPRERIENA